MAKPLLWVATAAVALADFLLLFQLFSDIECGQRFNAVGFVCDAHPEILLTLLPIMGVGTLALVALHLKKSANG
jgi:hypothetical protein